MKTYEGRREGSLAIVTVDGNPLSFDWTCKTIARPDSSGVSVAKARHNWPWPCYQTISVTTKKRWSSTNGSNGQWLQVCRIAGYSIAEILMQFFIRCVSTKSRRTTNPPGFPLSRKPSFSARRRHQFSLKCRPRFQPRVGSNQKHSLNGTDGKKESNNEK